MIDSISPYALLKASRPKPPAAYVTDYDLFSAAQQPYAAPPSSPPIAQAEQDAPVINARQMPAAPSRPLPGKTHYIADIHSRHTRAMSRAQLSRASISGQLSPPPQTPAQ